MTTYNKTNINDIFQSIKGAIAQDKQAGGTGDILRMEPGNTYTVRLLPAKDPRKTFFHYFQHGWTSYSSGQYVSALSLQTFNERDPIAEERFRILKTGSEAQKKKADNIKRAEKWLVNVYVINDPTNSENNGKVKILRYGKQLQAVIKDAIEGEDSDSIGPRIFDLSPNGVNLKIKVEKQGDYPSYVASKFSLPSEIKDLDEDSYAKIYESVFELDKVFTVKNADELKLMLKEHFHAEKSPSVAGQDEPEVPVNTQTKKPVTVSTDDDDEVNKLLEGLDLDK
jgi:hypothetical protein